MDPKEQAIQRLTTASLKKFSQQAKRITQDLGSDAYQLISLNINNGYNKPRPTMMRAYAAMEADVAMTPPQIKAGTANITVTVNAT